MAVTESIQIPAAGVALGADVVVPAFAHGVVVFAHGSGSGRHSPRNRRVAADLQVANLATVLVDLLTLEEERVDAVTAGLRFDIGLLAERVIAVTDWVRGHGPTATLGAGLFGASTGAAAALVAAAERPATVQAVVSRGGRPDLAGDHLRGVTQPTLLIVGELDPVVIELNREARELIPGETSFAVVAGATHLFEEPGALEQVARLARDWFVRHLRSVPRPQPHPWE
ncbi:hydrolase [Sphaerisporangium krabiense]|uniref:Pimeloyl-ACP methyl ester carboxylesterase n=1 Tax=Sphaerisporangium krabiense TaxID=763782 RepID=A0A7W8Z6A6_9ACTN|nr:hydrolase [Sphaerisporangium krabiense]MBB5628196.1 pimeloyl-ACP methyl ester carboxylesterase [Sphaerisporangium krabiense]GII66191.1 hydrolase [Sphaerisporangium krabiense]